MGSADASLFPRLQNGTISPPTRLQQTLKMTESVHEALPQTVVSSRSGRPVLQTGTPWASLLPLDGTVSVAGMKASTGVCLLLDS